MFTRIAILGLGQLGGSFALACRRAGIHAEIVGYDPQAASAEHLLRLGAIDAVLPLAEVVRNADLVILAAPLRTYPDLARTIASHLAPQAIVTDVGSVKCSMAALVDLLPEGQAIVPGHPISGSEKSGASASRGDLFEEKLCILTPLPHVPGSAANQVKALWQKIGARVLTMPVSIHDQIYAHVSHLPHLIAFVAASFMDRLGVEVPEDAETLRQFLRISRSNPRMWTDVFLENRTSLLPALAVYQAILRHLARELHSGPQAQRSEASATIAAAHLPRLLAASLISTVAVYEQHAGASVRRFGAGGMRDIVAPAATTPEAEIEAISAAGPAVALLIESILPHFAEIERLITLEDELALFALLTRMQGEAVHLVALNKRQ
ncbi:MAG: prephenate dehydrogenase [Alphaproteobacteria bacterium]